MTLATPKPASPPVRDWTRYVPLAEAAALLGVSVDTLRARCASQLAGNELAVCASPADGGKRQWFLSKGYDERLLSPTWAARHVDSDLTGYSLKQQREAFTRRECVEVFKRIRGDAPGHVDVSDKAIAACLAKFPDFAVSRSTLYKWASAYKFPSDLAKLVDHRGGARVTKGSDEAWAEFRSHYLCASRPSVRRCWKEVRRLAAENAWAWCSYSTCHGQLNERVSPQDQARVRTPEKYRTALAPFIKQDPESWRAGERWVGDHKQCDFWCRWKGTVVRLWLTTWMDWRTRKIVGFTISDSPNSSTILAALRSGLLDASNNGGPSEICIDNGKDYDAWVFHGQTKRQRRAKVKCPVDEALAGGIFRGLDIMAHFATPYGPNAKARMERWFRTLGAFFKTFATYTGEDIESKPEELNAILDAGRLVPSYDEAHQRISDFIAGYNENADHDMADLADAETGELLAPAEAFRRWADRRRAFADPAALDLLLQQWHRPVYVGRNGVSVTLRGRVYTYGQFAPELTPFKALRLKDRVPVRVSYDPDAIGTVKVYTIDHKFIATVAMNKLGGAHGSAVAMEHVAELNRQRKAYDKAQRTIAAHGMAGVLTNEEHLARVAAQQIERVAAAAVPATSMTIVRTPLDGQSKLVDMAEFRQAAGSDHQTFLGGLSRRPHSVLNHVPNHDTATRRDHEADDRPALDPMAILRRKHGTR